MTVEELIEKLKELDPKMDVTVYDQHGFLEWATKVSVEGRTKFYDYTNNVSVVKDVVVIE